MSTIRPTTNRNPWYRNKDGVLETTKRYDEIESGRFDFTNLLASGETVSSVSWDQDGVTISSSVLATPVVTWLVAGAGYATLKATLSTGRKLEQRMRWLATDATSGDYA